MIKFLFLSLLATSPAHAQDCSDEVNSCETRAKLKDDEIKACFERLEKLEGSKHKRDCTNICKGDLFGRGKFKECYDLCVRGIEAHRKARESGGSK